MSRKIVARGDLPAYDLDHPPDEDGDTTVHVVVVDGDWNGEDRHCIQVYHDDPRWEVEIPIAPLLDATGWTALLELSKARPPADRYRDALQEVASGMDREALERYESRHDGWPGDYLAGLGNREDAFAEGKRVGLSIAARVAQKSLDGASRDEDAA